MRHEDAVPRLPELIGLRAAVTDDAQLIAHIERCAGCQARLRRLRDIDARLRTLDRVAPPSARLERRILAIPEAGGQRARRLPRRHWAAAAACAMLLLAALVGVLATHDDDGTTAAFAPERVVQLAAPNAETVSGQIEIGAGEEGRIPVRIVVSGLPHGGGLFYGLWLTGADGAVSGGTFMPDGEGRCIVMLQIPAGAWTKAEITTGDRPPSPRTTVASGEL